MRLSAPTATRRAPRLPLVALTLAVATAAAAIAPSFAQAQSGPFIPICLGSAKLGESRADSEVAYRFGCNEVIVGYSVIALDRQIDSFDTEPVVLDDADEPVLGEAFTCSALLPGFGASCTGKAGVWSRPTGSLSLTSDPCVGPRPRFGLIVANAKGSTAGPFRLMSAKPGPAGRPLAGCPATTSRAKRKAGPR